MWVRIWGLVLALFLVAGTAWAGPEDIIRAKLKTAFPDVVVADIKPAALPNFYLVTSSNYDPIFVSGDGRFLIQGNVMEVRGSQLVSVFDEAMAGERKTALAAVKHDDLIVFPAVGKVKGVVYVFTDVDCPYCRKLHTEVPELNKKGIEVRYLAFPRTGPKSVAAGKMDKVWCAQDRLAALTDAKMGHTDPGAQRPLCKSPVRDQFALGVALGVTGTPAVMLEDGTEVGGYVPTAELIKDVLGDGS